MEVTDLYNKLCLYFGESTKLNIGDIHLNKRIDVYNQPTFHFIYNTVFFTITNGMKWEIKDKILIDLHNELTTLLRNRIINDVLDEK